MRIRGPVSIKKNFALGQHPDILALPEVEQWLSNFFADPCDAIFKPTKPQIFITVIRLVTYPFSPYLYAMKRRHTSTQREKALISFFTTSGRPSGKNNFTGSVCWLCAWTLKEKR